MRILSSFIQSAFGFAAITALAQGTFVYDQQWTTRSLGGFPGGYIQEGQPIGQSFTPAFDSVGFVQFNIGDMSSPPATGAVAYVNLRSDSITGPILATTDLVSMPARMTYPVFVFATPVTVTPGVTYYFQPVIQSGDDPMALLGTDPGYPGGASYTLGQSRSGFDVWFKEGIIDTVPEPSSALLLLLGGGLLLYVRRARHR